ncbi:MAG: HDOD domain-containing protein [Hahellaceae bacterium]|nr:HDOD domain-containing protein [Hahellaceae bacterium]MCP5210382.1 HDOD domain-containing protein [Hahellaceae bacterium]
MSNVSDSEFNKELGQRVDVGDLDIPMLPAVAQKVIQVTSDPDSDTAQLTKVIQSDQALAARVMNVANSVAYSPNGGVTSLQQAGSRLGMTMIRDIALASSINARIFKAPGFEGHIANIWQHALATALWSQAIAKRIKKDMDSAFLCGLLHSVGKPVMIQEAVDVAEEEDLTSDIDIIMEIVEELSSDAARLALTKWKMPNVIIDAVTHYKNYQDADEGKNLAMIVNAATILAEHMLTEFPEVEDLPGKAVFADLNLSEKDIDALREQIPNIRSALEEMKP